MNQDAEKRKLEWRAAQIELRRNFANTPAGFKSKDVEIAEENALKLEWEAYRKRQQNCLGSEYNCEQELFWGREQELKKISEAINGEKQKPVILYGLGGSGKSSLAHEWMRRNCDNYIHVLEVKYKYNLRDTICSDENLNIAGLTYKKEFHGNKTRYFHTKLKQLANHVRKYKTLLLIDACDFKKDRNLKYVFSLPCDLIVTTRVNPVLWGYENGILVETLQEKEWKEFCKSYLTEEYDKWDSVIKRQLDYSRGHFAWMLFTIRGIKEIQMKEQKESRRENVLFPIQQELREFEKDLFRHLNFSLKEKYVLQCLSLMPGYEMPVDILQAFTGCGEEILSRFEAFLFLERKETQVILHPMIAEAVKALFPVTCTSCARMIRRVAGWLQMRMELYSIEENRCLEKYSLVFAESFSRKADYLAGDFMRIYSFLEIQGYQMERNSQVSEDNC